MTARSIFEKKIQEKYFFYTLDRWTTPSLDDGYASGFVNEAWKRWEKYTSNNNLSNPTDKDYEDFCFLENIKGNFNQ